jgi:hypothetical protein
MTGFIGNIRLSFRTRIIRAVVEKCAMALIPGVKVFPGFLLTSGCGALAGKLQESAAKGEETAYFAKRTAALVILLVSN